MAEESTSTLIHRELIQLTILALLAVAAFIVTRSVAASSRDMNLGDAAEWYERGQRQLREGRADEAIDAFRRATVKNRDERRYVLALAHALEIKGQDAAARTALVTLRESTPDDPEINLQLARLAGGRQDVSEAVRYYHNALYAVWPNEGLGERRSLREELIRFLLAHQENNRALSELLAQAGDLPDDAEAHVNIARLFFQAGDDRRALDHFARALRLDPRNAEARHAVNVLRSNESSVASPAAAVEPS